MAREDAGDRRYRTHDSIESIRDREAFKQLFLEYYESLFRFAHRNLGSLEAAEDIVQDVFLALWKRRKTWKPTHSARAYLFKAVRNQIINYRRRAAIRLRDGADQLLALSSSDDPEGAYRLQELTRNAEDAVQRLPERCRSVFLLARDFDLTYAEIAVVLDISVKTVETHMSRALRYVRSRVISFRE